MKNHTSREGWREVKGLQSFVVSPRSSTPCPVSSISDPLPLCFTRPLASSRLRSASFSLRANHCTPNLVKLLHVVEGMGVVDAYPFLVRLRQARAPRKHARTHRQTIT